MTDRTLTIEYPRSNPLASHVRVELEDVRAANDLVIHFDFDRDGWVIESPTKMSWEIGEDYDEQLEEVAFVSAWSERAEAALREANGG